MLDIRQPPFVFPCFVEGRPLEMVDRTDRILVVHPYSGQVIGSVPRLHRDQVVRALEVGAAAGPCPSRHERSQILLRAAVHLERDRELVARLITWESGLCLKDTRHEVGRALEVLRAASREALGDDGRCYSFDALPGGPDRRGFTVREPLRLATAITPFNHPLNQVAHKVAPAIAAGTPLVLKPSERTPLSALFLASILFEAGLPGRMLAVVTGDAEVLGPLLVQHPSVELVSFTGGVVTGKRIAGMLGYRRALLELGGNDPLIVCAGADLDEAARLATEGAFANSGQRCTAVKRILVDHAVADAFAGRLAAAAARLRAGDPFDEATEVGTVISEEAAIRLELLAEQTIADGARLLAGGQRRGALYYPTVLDHCRPDSESVRTETFGPHAPIVRVSGPDEAIRIANDTPYGLSAGVCTGDLKLAHRFIRELRCGTVNIGAVPGLRTESTPFGGCKDSGLGVKEGVTEAMKALSFEKLYTLPWS